MLLDAVENRHSGRAFDTRPIPDDILESILEAGRRAPSCRNTQAWNFMIPKNSESRKKANEAMSEGNIWGERAPLMIVVVSHPDEGCHSHELPYFMMDVGLAVENMLLQAVHMGLMGHPTAGWDEEEMKKALNIPEDFRIVTVIFFGYEFEGEPTFLSEKNQEREKIRSHRKSLDEIVHWNTW